MISCPAINFAVLMRDGKTEPLGRQNDRGVDADDFAERVDQRTAGVARIERGVGLNHVVDQPAGLGTKRAAERADDAGGDAVLKTVRIADGDGELADANLFRIAQRRRDQSAGGNANHREIGAGIVADDGGVEAPAIAQSHGQHCWRRGRRGYWSE